MRLLNSSNLQLIDFPANKIPDYAILSHTWDEQAENEVCFEDMTNGRAEGKAGYEKIRQSCIQAAADGISYIWIDTCCIDKSSSAELSEAINSMYLWYQGAKRCYAYLADVPAGGDNEEFDSALAKSRWFKRGWTLQELIGPKPSDMLFFSCGWTKIGSKSTLSNKLSEITHITENILTNPDLLEFASLARRMSWASSRETTRTEDIAYCLMGIFDVNMPLLYGEREKAFMRLQEEIMKHSDDQSLFAWTDPSAPADYHSGLLAESPKQFLNSGNIRPYREWEVSTPFSMSNKGLRIELPLTSYKTGLYVAALDCPVPPDYDGWLGIYLKRVPTGKHQYVRVKPHDLNKIKTRGSIKTVFVSKFSLEVGSQDLYPLHGFQLRKGPTQDDGYKLIRTVPLPTRSSLVPLLTSKRWPPEARMPYTFKISRGSNRLAGVLLLKRVDDEKFAIMLGSTTDFGVGFDVAPMPDDENLERLQDSFNPRPPGTDMVLKNHQVRVNVQEQVYQGAKYYMVDLNVKALYQPLNPIDVIRDIVPGLQSQSDERPPNAAVTFSRGFGLFERPFRSPRT